jgi:cell division protein ZapA
MLNKNKTALIRLCNKSYEIRCPEGEAATLQRAAQKLNDYVSKKKKSHKQLDDFQALLLAALHLSHELVSAEETLVNQQNHIREFISSLESKLSKSSTKEFITEEA